MKAKTLLKSATLEDEQAIQACAAAAYSIYIERIGKPPAPMIADFQSAIEANKVVIAKSKGTLAGFVIFYRKEDSMHLENIAIAPDFQGLGVGGMLIEFVEQQASKLWLRSVDLYTNEAMTENLSLYSHLGYTEYDRRNEDGFNRVYFRKLLSTKY